MGADLAITAAAPIIGWKVQPYHWRMRKARLAAGFTQAELGLLVGLPTQYVGLVELLKRKPTADEKHDIADALSVPAEVLWPELLDALPVVRRGQEFSLDQAQVQHLQAKQMLAAGEQRVEQQALQGSVAAALTTLPPVLAQVLTARFGLDGGEPQQLGAVAAHLGVSRERIRQLEAKALAQLRQRSASHELRTYVR